MSYLEVAGSFGFLAGPISAGALLDAFGGVEAGAKAYKPAIVSARCSDGAGAWGRKGRTIMEETVGGSRGVRRVSIVCFRWKS